MKPSTLIALAKSLGDLAKPLKGNMTPGCHKVDETIVVKVTGRIDKSANTMVVPTTSIPLKPLLGIILERMGATRDSTAKMLDECITEALLYGSDRQNDDGDELPDVTATGLIESRMKDVDAAMERVTKLTADLPKVPKNGGTRVKVEFTVVEFGPPNVDDDLAEAA